MMSEAILTFQSQLSGIMETVLKTAVFEITWLVESSFQGEVIRSRQEVEVLRKRLQVAESRWREGSRIGRSRCVECGRAGVSNEEMEHRPTGAQSGVEEGCDVKEEKVSDRTRSSCLLAELDKAPPDTAVTPSPTKVPVKDIATPTNLEGDTFDLMHKEADLKEDQDSNFLQRNMQVTAESNASSYPEEKSKGAVELGDQSRTRDSVEMISELDPVLKKGPKLCAAWLNSSASEYIMYEKVTVLEQGDSDTETNGPNSSCTAEQETEPRPVQVYTQRKPHGETKDREGIQIANVISLSHSYNTVNHMRRKSTRKMRDGTSKSKQQQLVPSGKCTQMSVSESTALVLSGAPQVGESASCGQHFTASMDIKTLQGLGTEDKQISCIYCGKCFSYVSRLKIHLLKHTGEKPFSCTHCGKRFTIARNLERHQHIHWGDATFCCAQCGKRFKRADHLKVHQRVHTGERPYSCTQCNKSFRFSGDLNTHKRVHTGEKPYCCMLCGNRFSQLRQLKSHQRKHKGLGRFDQLIK